MRQPSAESGARRQRRRRYSLDCHQTPCPQRKTNVAAVFRRRHACLAFSRASRISSIRVSPPAHCQDRGRRRTIGFPLSQLAFASSRTVATTGAAGTSPVHTEAPTGPAYPYARSPGPVLRSSTGPKLLPLSVGQPVSETPALAEGTPASRIPTRNPRMPPMISPTASYLSRSLCETLKML